MNIEDLLWREILADLDLQCGMIVNVDPGTPPANCAVISAGGIPASPFNGSENAALLEVIQECLAKQPAPHEHGIGNFALSQLVKRLGRADCIGAVAAFFVQENETGRIAFLGFPNENRRDRERPMKAIGITQPLIDHFLGISKLAYYENKLAYTELYLREIAHDLASNIQAVFGQLSYMRTGRLNERAMIKKADEVLREVQNVYGIAESLDVTLDRSFSIQCVEKIDIQALFEALRDEYSAEAQEKGIKIEVNLLRNGIYAFGERKTFRLCLVHLLVNAIKYSHDNTTVELRAGFQDGCVIISVCNKGVGIPKGKEGLLIWDFGYRSSYAKQRHVNGSGIGLYTAKRIVLAHGGRIWHEQQGDETRFLIGLPLGKT